MVLPPIISIKQVVHDVLSKDPILGVVEKGPHFRTTQRAMARLCVKKGLVGFASTTSSFSVLNPYGGDVHSVRFFPKPSRCSCPSTGRCYHIFAVQMALREPESNIKDKEKYSLSVLMKNRRGRERKSGSKRPRPKDYDYDVDPAPDAPFPLDRSSINPIATSTPKKVKHSIAMDISENLNETVVVDEYSVDESLSIAADINSGQIIEHGELVSPYPWENHADDHSFAITSRLSVLSECLSGSNWLTDEAIEIAIRSFLADTNEEAFLLWDYCFTQLASKNMHDAISGYACHNQALNFDNFMFLCNPGAHWFLVVANLKRKEVVCIDSLTSITSPTKLGFFFRHFKNHPGMLYRGVFNDKHRRLEVSPLFRCPSATQLLRLRYTCGGKCILRDKWAAVTHRIAIKQNEELDPESYWRK